MRHHGVIFPGGGASEWCVSTMNTSSHRIIPILGLMGHRDLGFGRFDWLGNLFSSLPGSCFRSNSTARASTLTRRDQPAVASVCVGAVHEVVCSTTVSSAPSASSASAHRTCQAVNDNSSHTDRSGVNLPASFERPRHGGGLGGSVSDHVDVVIPPESGGTKRQPDTQGHGGTAHVHGGESFRSRPR